MLNRSSYRVGMKEPPQRSVCATGHFSRTSSQMGNGSLMYSLLKMS